MSLLYVRRDAKYCHQRLVCVHASGAYRVVDLSRYVTLVAAASGRELGSLRQVEHHHPYRTGKSPNCHHGLLLKVESLLLPEPSGRRVLLLDHEANKLASLPGDPAANVQPDASPQTSAAKVRLYQEKTDLPFVWAWKSFQDLDYTDKPPPMLYAENPFRPRGNTLRKRSEYFVRCGRAAWLPLDQLEKISALSA